MAGDWIKMRVGLAEEPEVIEMAALLMMDEDHVVGKLCRLWSWFDQKTRDGCAAGVTKTWIDAYLKVSGFADAMSLVGWLDIEKNGARFVARMPGFKKHSGASAKKRADTAARVARHRDEKRNGDVTQNCYISNALRREVFERDNFQCRYCGRAYGEMLPHETEQDSIFTVDHVTPESRGGDTTVDNLVACCKPCNCKKAGRTPQEAGMTLQKCNGKLLQKRYQRREEKNKNTGTGSGAPHGPDRPEAEREFFEQDPILAEAAAITIEARPPGDLIRSAFRAMRLRDLSDASSLVLWHSRAIGCRDPVVGDTRAHLLLVIAAGLYAAEAPQEEIRKSRVALFSDIIRRQRWRMVHYRIPQAAEKLAEFEKALTEFRKAKESASD